jgi:hypothetical protein
MMPSVKLRGQTDDWRMWQAAGKDGMFDCQHVGADIEFPPSPSPTVFSPSCPPTTNACSFTNRHNRLFTRASWCHSPYGIIMSLRHSMPTLSHGMPTIPAVNTPMPAVSHLNSATHFVSDYLSTLKERLREQNTNMAGCDVWEWGFQSQPLDGCVVAVQVSMFVINGHEHRDSLSVEASSSVP